MKKRRVWPLVLLLLLVLAGVVAAGGYVYWKYGDELFSQKENTVKRIWQVPLRLRMHTTGHLHHWF